MPVIETPFGPIHAARTIERHPSGALRSVIAIKESPLRTPLGLLVPQFESCTLRRRQLPSITFHDNGMLNVLPLDRQVPIRTPLGMLPAEKIILYPDGSLRRLFPLDGCLTGYWGQEDERRLACPLTLDTPQGELSTFVMTIYFGPQGNLRSVTLWPGEVTDIATPLGTVPVRAGVAFHDSGALRSVEPALPTAIPTPIGELLAYDPDAHGITGDSNSLVFSETGELRAATSISHEFLIDNGNAAPVRIAPAVRINPVDGETREPAPLTLAFHDPNVTIQAEGLAPVTAHASTVQVRRHVPLFPLAPSSPTSLSPPA